MVPIGRSVKELGKTTVFLKFNIDVCEAFVVYYSYVYVLSQ